MRPVSSIKETPTGFVGTIVIVDEKNNVRDNAVIFDDDYDSLSDRLREVGKILNKEEAVTDNEKILTEAVLKSFYRSAKHFDICVLCEESGIIKDHIKHKDNCPVQLAKNILERSQPE